VTDAIGKAITRRVPSGSSCMATAQPGANQYSAGRGAAAAGVAKEWRAVSRRIEGCDRASPVIKVLEVDGSDASERSVLACRSRGS
jgi:hypothetical protein